MEPKRILDVCTRRTGDLKYIIDRICNVLSDCYITFIAADEKNRGSCVWIWRTRESGRILKFNLKAKLFDHIRCDKPKITVGVNLHDLNRMFKWMGDDDTVIIYMEQDNLLRIQSYKV